MNTQGPLNCNNRKREKWLDAVKGVAIILVVMGHTQAIPIIQGLLSACYMQLFFVISGYTLTVKKGLISNKITRLVVPYLGWACFYYLVYVITSFCNGCVQPEQLCQKLLGVVYSRYSLYPLSAGNKMVFFPPGAEPLWFLTCMFLATLAAVPLIKTSKYFSIFLLVVYAGATLLFAYCPILLPWSIDTVFIAAIFIYCGYKIKDNLLKMKYSIPVLILLMTLYSVLVYFNIGINMSVRNYGCFEIPSIAIILFFVIGVLGTIIYSACFKIIENTKLCTFFAYLGRMSLTILCAHMLFANWFKIIVSSFRDYDGVFYHWIVIFPTRLVFIITGCIIIAKAREYFMKLVSSFKNRWSKPV